MEGGGLHVPTKAQGMASSGSACGRAKPQSARAAAPAQKKYLAVHPLTLPTLPWEAAQGQQTPYPARSRQPCTMYRADTMVQQEFDVLTI